MKHINITNWQGNITDWTKFNYIYGGLDETIADRVNLSIPGTNLRNYFRKSENLISLPNIPSRTRNGITYKVENGVITIDGTTTARTNIDITLNTQLNAGTYSCNCFNTDYSARDQVVFDMENVSGGTATYVQYMYGYGNATRTTSLSKSVQIIRIIIPRELSFTNASFKPMLVTGSTVPTTYEPYGSMVMVENVGKAFIDSNCTFEAGTYRVYVNLSDMVVATTRTLPISMIGYTCISDGQTYDPTWDKVIYNGYSTLIYVTNKAYISKAEWIEKEGNNPILYPLATPKITVFGQVDLGTLAWVYRTTPHVMQNTQITNIALPPNNGTIANISCPVYKNDTANNVYNNVQDKTISVSSTGILQVYDSAYTDATIFKSAMNGVILIYEAKDTSNANMLGMVKPSDSAPTSIENSMSLDELLEPANEER